MKQESIQIQNVKCSGCETRILSKLKTINGIHNVTYDEIENKFIIDYESPASLDTVNLQLKKMGYPLVKEDNTLHDKVNSYISCALGKIENKTTQAKE